MPALRNPSIKLLIPLDEELVILSEIHRPILIISKKVSVYVLGIG